VYPPKPLPASPAEPADTSAETAHLHYARDFILLPRTLVDQLMELPGDALKVYVHFRSLDQNEFSIRIPEIGEAVGRRKRSVTESLKILRENGLITRKKGKGNRPNTYSFPLLVSDAGRTINQSDPSPSTAPLPSIPELLREPAEPVNRGQLGSNTALIPNIPEDLKQTGAENSEVVIPPAVEQCTALAPKTEESEAPALTQATTPPVLNSGDMKLIATIRRPANDLLTLLKIMIQNQPVMLGELDTLDQNGPQADAPADPQKCTPIGSVVEESQVLTPPPVKQCQPLGTKSATEPALAVTKAGEHNEASAPTVVESEAPALTAPTPRIPASDSQS
jgi:hypothetical protein